MEGEKEGGSVVDETETDSGVALGEIGRRDITRGACAGREKVL
jgi:hypothetical protein